MASTSAVLNPDDRTQDVVALPPTRTKTTSYLRW